MTLVFAFGAAFQLAGDPDAARRASASSPREQLRDKRRYFIVGAFVLAAVLTPPDVISQLSLAIPLMLLYEGSIWSVRMVEKKAQAAAPPRPRQTPRQRNNLSPLAEMARYCGDQVSRVLMRRERPVERREALGPPSVGPRAPEAVPPGNRNGP